VEVRIDPDHQKDEKFSPAQWEHKSPGRFQTVRCPARVGGENLRGRMLSLNSSFSFSPSSIRLPVDI
jgi:hypothetical protein